MQVMKEEKLVQREGQLSESLARCLAKALSGLRFGSVTLKVHEGEVVLIERLERIRASPS
jgi:hypothetical protein